MKILLDENVDNRLKQVLESNGFEVTTTFEEDLTGKTDVEIVEHSFEHQFVILTHDDDFLSLVQDGTDSPTVVYMPQRIRFREMKQRVLDLDKDLSLQNSIEFL